MIAEDQNYLEFLKHLKAMCELKNKCRAEGEKSIYSNNDVRNVIFNQVMNTINDYYLSLLSPMLLNRLRPAFDSGMLKDFFPNQDENKLYEDLGFLFDHNYLATWHNMAKVKFVYNIWTVFEDYIDFIYMKIVPKEEINSLKDSNYKKIEKTLVGKIDDKTAEELRCKLSAEYISVNNKYNSIFNTISNPQLKSNIVDFRNFLSFFNVLRNSLHRNSRPQKDYNFKTRIGTFRFEKDKHIDCFTFTVIHDSFSNFIDLFVLIRDELPFGEEIFNTAVLVKG